MTIEITVPALGESVTEATVGQWFKKPGDAVKADEPLVELETDKVTVEVPAPAAGVLADIKVPQGTHGRHRLGAGVHQGGCRIAAAKPRGEPRAPAAKPITAPLAAQRPPPDRRRRQPAPTPAAPAPEREATPGATCRRRLPPAS